MNENGKMRPIETFPGTRKGEDDGGGELHDIL
jgi:hypothetical protein